MKIVVPIKRVIDAYVNIRVKSDGSGVENNNVKMSMNPFDEIAVEEAIRLKEKGIAKEIIVVTIGSKTDQDILRTAMALGADRACLIETDIKPIEPLLVAKILKHYVTQEQAELIIMGKQAIDSDNNQSGQMLAGLLNWSQGTNVSQLTIDNGSAIVVREVDGGLETLKLSLPTLITTDLRLNNPRYASLPNIMKAKSKPLAIIPLTDMGIDVVSKIKTISITAPPARKPGIIVKTVAELLEKLRTEAKVIE